MQVVRLATAAVVLALGGGLPHPAAAAAPPTVTVAAPQYDSPRALVPAIVTVHRAPTTHKVSLSMISSGGAAVECVGPTWRNPKAATVSRKCYVRLPSRPASLVLTGTAVLTKAGAKPVVVSGRAARRLLANGPASRPMTLARARQVERCFNTTDSVWLTFDDNATKAGLTRILATLARNNVRGRFFFTGIYARSNAAAMRTITKQGHLVANHTSTHAALSRASEARVRSELRNGVRATTSPRLLRPPFGAGALTARLDSLAARGGYHVCRWTTDTYDWEGPSATTMANRVRYGDHRTAPVEAGGVILMHGKGRHTASGLQKIIDAVRAKGLPLDPLRR